MPEWLFELNDVIKELAAIKTERDEDQRKSN